VGFDCGGIDLGMNVKAVRINRGLPANNLVKPLAHLNLKRHKTDSFQDQAAAFGGSSFKDSLLVAGPNASTGASEAKKLGNNDESYKNFVRPMNLGNFEGDSLGVARSF